MQHGMNLVVGDSEQALILKYTTVAGKGSHLRPHAEHALAHSAGCGRVYLRPGASDDQGWIWLVGLPAQMARQFERTQGQSNGRATFTSFGDAFIAVSGEENAEPGI